MVHMLLGQDHAGCRHYAVAAVVGLVSRQTGMDPAMNLALVLMHDVALTHDTALTHTPTIELHLSIRSQVQVPAALLQLLFQVHRVLSEHDRVPCISVVHHMVHISLGQVQAGCRNYAVAVAVGHQELVELDTAAAVDRTSEVGV